METVGASLKECGGLAEDVSLDQGTPVLGRLTGSYKRGYKSPKMGYTYIVTLLITPSV